MPTDAKCGLLVGVGLVLAVAVLFFQKDPPPPVTAAPAPPPPVTAAPAPPPTASFPPPASSGVPARPVSRTVED